MKRTNNHMDLVASLKELNGMIRSASNIRIWDCIEESGTTC
jgi:hypothetical protein